MVTERGRWSRSLREQKKGEEGTERPHGGGRSRSLAWGGTPPPPRGKRVPPGIHPRTCAPVIAGSLWRLPASKRRVAPERGNRIRRCMAASLAPACCTISEMVRHALWSGGAPLHSDPGGGMAGGGLTEVELRDTPCLCPCRPHEDVGRPPGPGDPGKDHQAHGPAGEGTTGCPGWGCQGGRGCSRGHGRLQR